jgi:hypothetical protein
MSVQREQRAGRVPIDRQQLGFLQPCETELPVFVSQADERFHQAGDFRRCPQSLQAIRGSGSVEEAEQFCGRSPSFSLLLVRASWRRVSFRSEPAALVEHHGSSHKSEFAVAAARTSSSASISICDSMLSRIYSA